MENFNKTLYLPLMALDDASVLSLFSHKKTLGVYLQEFLVYKVDRFKLIDNYFFEGLKNYPQNEILHL